MSTTTRTRLGPASLAAFSLLGGAAGAQDADLQAQVEDLQGRYEAATAAQDWDALAALFAEDAIFLPLTGGQFEGPEGVRDYYGQSGLTAIDATSSVTRTLGEGLVLDIGTFTATATGEAGEMELAGEYVVLAQEGEEGLRIRSVTAFPVRQPPAPE